MARAKKKASRKKAKRKVNLTPPQAALLRRLKKDGYFTESQWLDRSEAATKGMVRRGLVSVEKGSRWAGYLAKWPPTYVVPPDRYHITGKGREALEAHESGEPKKKAKKMPKKKRNPRKEGRLIEGYHGYSDTERISRLLSTVITESHEERTSDGIKEILGGLMRYVEDIDAGNMDMISQAETREDYDERVAESELWSRYYGILDDAIQKMGRAQAREATTLRKMKRERERERKRKAKGTPKAVKTAKASAAVHRRRLLRQAMRGT